MEVTTSRTIHLDLGSTVELVEKHGKHGILWYTILSLHLFARQTLPLLSAAIQQEPRRGTNRQLSLLVQVDCTRV